MAAQYSIALILNKLFDAESQIRKSKSTLHACNTGDAGEGGDSGNAVYDFFIGRELNPRLWGDSFDLKEELSKSTEDADIVSLVMKMLARDPEQRPTAKDCLREWCDKVFPDTFRSVLFHIGAAMQRAPALYADNRISLIRYHINSVFEKCFSSKNAVLAEKFNEPIEPSLFRLI